MGDEEINQSRLPAVPGNMLNTLESTSNKKSVVSSIMNKHDRQPVSNQFTNGITILTSPEQSKNLKRYLLSRRKC